MDATVIKTWISQLKPILEEMDTARRGGGWSELGDAARDLDEAILSLDALVHERPATTTIAARTPAPAKTGRLHHDDRELLVVCPARCGRDRVLDLVAIALRAAGNPNLGDAIGMFVI